MVGQITLHFSKQASLLSSTHSTLGLHVVPTQMVPAEDTPILKSNLVFDTWYSEYFVMTYLILGIYAIYIILVGD